MGCKISLKAAEDLEDIWLYTFETWSPEQADRYVELIFEEIEYLAANPKKGKDFSHVRKNYRYLKIKSHLIFYRHFGVKSDVEIIRILHQRMDIESRLSD